MITKPAFLLLWIPQGKACFLQDHQACMLLWIPQGNTCVLQDHQACLPTSGKGLCFAGSPSLYDYFCGYLREMLVFCRIAKLACLLLWILQGKACVLQDHQACLPTSVDT
ncbi:hypothetical protein DPMN_180118 [Dreissena polymorpha]|uniref:Uncharacterized protein n=1 Tax=Dreissena polymorpha TaxID=45954 RepID=A0A9D4EG24_DREPO|nr:hypothetical protein DPMN_179893 [Dreissena polymorpha]KAH3778648.1 hypothetical protein DPMN_180118 [Dreissena polymorpha]